jgi:RNA polymerase sigma factor (sigma-70 family)
VESFDELVVQYKPMIHKIIRSLHIYRNEDEFYQTGLIALWEATKSFDDKKGSFSNYAYTCMKGKMLYQMNQTNQWKEKNIFPENGFFDLIEDHDNTPLFEKEAFRTYCEGLTKKETKWVLASFIEQLSNKEIAEREKVSVSAVKQWKLGALTKLKVKVDKYN